MTGNTGKVREYINIFINYMLLPVIYVVMFGFFITVDWMGQQQNRSYNRIINGGMFLIITLVLLWAYCAKFLRLNKISKQLKAAAKTIETEHGSSNEYLWEQYKDENPQRFFEDQDLIASYKSFQEEKKRLEQNYASNHICRIEDYLNQDLIDVIADKNLLNIIPGIMTGLGILGTFIGLTLGLRYFSTETAEQMMSSIPPLMDGIKIAFHTSIYGMAFSLAFNAVYKNALETTYESMDDFLRAFSRFVCPDAEADGMSRLIDSQQRQSEAIVDPLMSTVQSLNANMAMMLAVQKLQHEEMRRLPQELGDCIGKRLGEIIIPQFQNTNQSLENFAGTISDIQVSGMENLVDHFVSQMNDSMAGSFTELAGIISKTSDLQKQNNEYVHDLFIRLGELTVDIKKISELSAETVKSMSDYVQSMNNVQGRLIQNFSALQSTLETSRQVEEKELEYLSQLVGYEEQIGKVTQQFSLAVTEQVERLGILEHEVLENTKGDLEAVSASARECNEAISAAAVQCSEVLSASVNEYSNLLSDSVARYNEALSKETQRNMGKLTEIVESFSKVSSEEAGRAYRQAQIQQQALSDAAKKEIQTIYELSDTKTGDLNRASLELSEATNKLNMQLMKSLKDTFTMFDQELSEITKHLGETVSEVDKTTERVPKVVSAAYEGMEKSFDDMQKQMVSMVHMLDIMQRNMPDAVQRILADESVQADKGNDNGETT